MQEDEVYFEDVKKEIDSAKQEIKSNTIKQKDKEEKMTVVLADVEKKLDCTKDDIFLNAKSANASRRVVKRGEVFQCSLGIGIGSEMQKVRPCVVLSNNVSNNFSTNVIIAPITHTNKNIKCFSNIKPKYDINNNLILDGYVNTSNIRAVSKARLGSYVVKLTNADMRKVNASIYDSLGTMVEIKELKNKINLKEEQVQIFKIRSKEQEKHLIQLYFLVKAKKFDDLLNYFGTKLNKFCKKYLQM